MLNEFKHEVLSQNNVNSTKSPEIRFNEMVKQIGFKYTSKTKNLDKDVHPQNLSPINANEFGCDELVKYLHNVTGIAKGGKFSHGIKGRLAEVIN